MTGTRRLQTSDTCADAEPAFCRSHLYDYLLGSIVAEAQEFQDCVFGWCAADPLKAHSALCEALIQSGRGIKKI